MVGQAIGYGKGQSMSGSRVESKSRVEQMTECNKRHDRVGTRVKQWALIGLVPVHDMVE